MSAIPKKKLCWNCEGHISHDVDNCPYCGVYVHSREFDEDSIWNPNYQKIEEEEREVASSKKDAIPAPLYQISLSGTAAFEEEDSSSRTPQPKTLTSAPLASPYNIFNRLKQELFPILFLMMGSIFFLFGAVLLLFSENGMLVLKWEETYSTYFLLLALPLITAGWHYLQQIEEDS